MFNDPTSGDFTLRRGDLAASRDHLAAAYARSLSWWKKEFPPRLFHNRVNSAE
jgi:hypothetical protein